MDDEHTEGRSTGMVVGQYMRPTSTWQDELFGLMRKEQSDAKQRMAKPKPTTKRKPKSKLRHV
jgi:hypothetical protein